MEVIWCLLFQRFQCQRLIFAINLQRSIEQTYVHLWIAEVHLPRLFCFLCKLTSFWNSKQLEEVFRHNFAHKDIMLLEKPFLVYRERSSTIWLSKSSFDINASFELRLASISLRKLKLFSKLFAFQWIYDELKVWRVYMVTKQCSSLSINIDILNCIKKHIWLWLVSEVTYNSKLLSFNKPMKHVNFFCRVKQFFAIMKRVIKLNLLSFVLSHT